MPRYLVESPHTDQECLQALDEMAAQKNELLGQCNFGCMAGDHRGWAFVDKASDQDARDLVPSFIRTKARVVKVDQFTPAQIAAFHKS